MHFQPSTDCRQLPLPGSALLYRSCEKAAWGLGFWPISLKDDFPILQRGRTCTEEVHAGNWDGLSQQGNPGADVALLCFPSLVCPVASLRPFPLVGPEHLPSVPLLMPIVSSCCHSWWALGNNVAGTQSFWGKCKLQAAPSPSVFSSESSISESWTGDRVLWRRAGFRSVPRSQALAVQKWDFLKRGHAARAGRKRALAEADAPAFLSLEESCSHQTSAVPQTIPSFGETRTAHRGP